MSAQRLRANTSVTVALALAGLLAAGLSACDATSAANDRTQVSGSSPASASDSPVTVTTNLENRLAVPVDHVLRLAADGGTLKSVEVRSADAGQVAGKLSADHSHWVASQLLEPGASYAVQTVAVTDSGESSRSLSRFRTVPLTLDQQTWADVAPLQGETVGVGMPVIVTFDLPVTDNAALEKHMSVSAVPAQRGSWHWISDREVHWRPATYWRAGSDVTVDLDINSVPAGSGIYGQESRHIQFHIGSSVVSKVNAQTHQMKTYVNGKLVRTTPITTGKPGFTTRSGVKVIIEKYRQKRMNSETVGISPGDPDAYDIDDVEYAMRVTYSGEFLHAAPWSVGSQGYDNVSHGCTGMSTANAAWIYNISKRGDVVEYTGTDRPMTLTNGWGDWNLSFSAYAQGSAL